MEVWSSAPHSCCLWPTKDGRNEGRKAVVCAHAGPDRCPLEPVVLFQRNGTGVHVTIYSHPGPGRVRAHQPRTQLSPALTTENACVQLPHFLMGKQHSAHQKASLQGENGLCSLWHSESLFCPGRLAAQYWSEGSFDRQGASHTASISESS